MTDLSALIVALEGATGPSRELDLECWWWGKASQPGVPMEPAYKAHNLKMNDAPRYTSSVDAALTLVPEGWEWTAHGFDETLITKPDPSATVYRGQYKCESAYGKTVAIAIAAAALKARQASSTPSDQSPAEKELDVSTPVSAPLGASMSPSPSDDARAGRDGRSGVGHGLPSIMGSMTLADMECLVALDDGGTGWIIARSDFIRERDILMECSTDDNGFNPSWSEGLAVGLYLLTIRPWSFQSYEGDWEAGIDVMEVRSLWTVPSSASETPPSQQVPTPSDNT